MLYFDFHLHLIFIFYICFYSFTEPRGDSQLPGPSGVHINLPSSRDSDTEAAATTPAAGAAAASGKRIYLSFLVFSLSYNLHHTSSFEVFPTSPQGWGVLRKFTCSLIFLSTFSLPSMLL